MFDRDRWIEIYEALSKNKLRTVLTAFGVAWGMIMLIIMIGAGKGLENATMSNFRNSAKNTCYVYSMRTTMAYKGFQRNRRVQLNFDDTEALKTAIPELKYVCPSNQLGGYRGANNVTHGVNTGAFTVRGEIPDYFKLYQKKLLMGRFLNDSDQSEKRKVCLIGQRVWDMLFTSGADPIGDYIKINGVSFKVVGVYKSNKRGEEADEDTKTIYIPFSSFTKAFNQGNKVGWFSLMADESVPIDDLKGKIFSVLMSRHDVHPEDIRAFGYGNESEEYEQVQGIFTGIRGLSLVVGIFSLLAGAIGISNIMLIVVKERTKELGIRRAIGATPWSIQSQIITEAVLLTTVAGVAGIIVGVWLLELVDKNVGDLDEFQHPSVSFSLVLNSFLFLLFIGVLAGLLPANRAVRIKPVEALRAEG